eukprot:TRINITY_DN1808_c0_g1_i1.p1 TRINITY_DN1808_c0_g1~~TRINITY_DN1808_c0_g1_i1.p1  ORF type:complete len:1028 (+),score=203.23 TRINITY_DN1808_c0_g1_i1:64-3147(+)
MADSEAAPPMSCEQSQHVLDALKYLEEKGVKQLLHSLTQSLLVQRPPDPHGHMMQQLRALSPSPVMPAKRAEESESGSNARSVAAACTFLAMDSSGPRAAVHELLKAAVPSFRGHLYLFSSPGCRGRRVRTELAASRFTSQDFLLIASSNSQAVVGQPSTPAQEACLKSALASPGGFASDSLAACPVSSQDALEGILLAEGLDAGLDMLPSVQLWAAVLAERLERLRWQQEAKRASSVVRSMLHCLDKVAQVETRESDEAQTAVEKVVPDDVLRGCLRLPDVTVLQADKRSGALLYTDAGGHRLTQQMSKDGVAMRALDLTSRSGSTEILCSESPEQHACEICIACPESSFAQESEGDAGIKVGSRELSHVVVCFASSHGDGLDHFDLVAAESLARSTMPAALQARVALQQLLTAKLRRLCMQTFVSDLSTANTTTDFVNVMEQTVLAVTHSSHCSVYFIDDDNEEVWAPPTNSVPELVDTPIGQGLAGKIAKMAQDKAHENRGVLLSNDPSSCLHWSHEDESEHHVTRNFMIVPIMTAGQVKQPIGLIMVSNKRALRQSGPGQYIHEDAEWLDWLAKAASSHLERLQLDVMFTKTMLEREATGEAQNDTLKKEDEALMSEYYSKDVRASKTRPTRARASAGDEVQTVHQLLDIVDTSLLWDQRASEAVTAESSEDVVTIPECHADPNQWRIDYWALSDKDQFALFVTALRMFDLPDQLSLPVSKLQRFFSAIKSNYRAVPFHNFHHALATVHYASRLTKVAQLDRVLTQADLFAIVIAGLCHDTDHRGHTNAFEMMTRSELALRYNDYSPLENHHCAKAFEVAFSSPDVNIFRALPSDVYNVVRKRMVAGILATDMKHHGHHVGLLRDFELGEVSDSQSQFLVEVMVHAADISNPYMPPDISNRWAACLNEEFTQQVADEEYMGLPVTAFMAGLNDRQVAAKALMGFIDFVITPLTSSMFRLFPELHEPKQFLEQNRAAAAAALEKPEDSKVEFEKKATRLPKRIHQELRKKLTRTYTARQNKLSS